MKYNRILLKLSGESLQGAQGYGLSTDVLHSYAAQIRQVVEAGPGRRRDRRRQHLPRPARRRAGIRPREGRSDGDAGHDHQFAGPAIGARKRRRAGPRADVDPHGAYRRILRQGTRFGVPRGRRGGHHRRRDVESLLHDRFGGGAARRGDRSRRPAQRNPRSTRYTAAA